MLCVFNLNSMYSFQEKKYYFPYFLLQVDTKLWLHWKYFQNWNQIGLDPKHCPATSSMHNCINYLMLVTLSSSICEKVLVIATSWGSY